MRSKMSDLPVRAAGPGQNMKPDLRVCADLADLSRRAAEAMVGTVNDAVQTRGTCSLVLTGGSTPRALYRLLASLYRPEIRNGG